MDETTKKAVIQALLSLGIALLGKVIPVLAGVTATPIIGWLVGLLTSYLSGVLSEMITTWARYREIDAQVNKEVEEAGLATQNLDVVQKDPNASEADRAKALEKFRLSMAALTRYRVRPS